MRAVDKFIDFRPRVPRVVHPGDDLRALGYLTDQDSAYRSPVKADAAAVRNLDALPRPKSPPRKVRDRG